MEPVDARALQAFLGRHPWTPALERGGRPLDYLWRYRVEATPAQLWPYLIDTSRLNRALGVSPMELDERDGVLHGSSRFGLAFHEWVEPPWDWVAHRSTTAVRVYRRGFLELCRVIYELEPVGDRALDLLVYFGWIPRTAWGRLALRLGMPSVGRGYAAALRDIESNLGTRMADIDRFRRPAAPLPDDVVGRMASLRQQLVEAGADREALDRLLEHIERGDETELHRLRVVPLARRWNLDRDRLLSACLHGARAGLTEVTFDVICPHCRGVRERVKTLGDLPARGSCDVCDIGFTTETDDAIEVTFGIHPSIRDVPEVHYCSAEPATKLHIALQQTVEAGGRRQVDLPNEAGRYRARVRGSKDYHLVDVIAGRAEAGVEAEANADAPVSWTAGQACPPRLVAGSSLTLINPGVDNAQFVLEHARWSDDSLRPAHLLSNQEFRDLFSAEYLSADIQLSVGEQTILFTDIVGSTRFYGERGDPGAFVEVRRHFVELYDEVKAHHGAVVKTIGDAAMAAFTNPVDAVRAARGILRRFPPQRADTPIRLRASLHRGPCIAVNLNAGLDYFGNTVNLAAKLQALAGAGEIVFSRAVYDAPGVSTLLGEFGAAIDERPLVHTAFDRPVDALCWRVNVGADANGDGNADVEKKREPLAEAPQRRDEL